jgi:dTDP-glucose 4,6-dehydratase
VRKILITGGAGFIGSHFVEGLAAGFPEHRIVVLDKMTYAADFGYIAPLIDKGRAQLVVGDVCDFELCRKLVRGCDVVVHAAAESHVDRSFHSSILFTQTNALGTHTIMEACREAKVARIIHVSTDEVYGEILSGDCDETGGMNPTNPYSASKAAAEMIVNGYRHSFNLPVIVVRANNIYGIRQFPEKLIPRCIMSLIDGEKIPLHGDGSNVRHYLAAPDFASALVLLVNKGVINEIYNIGSNEEHQNREIARMICEQFNTSFEESVKFVQDRPFNDRRYSISWDKISKLGWKPKHSLPKDIAMIVGWYRKNADAVRGRLSFLLNT